MFDLDEYRAVGLTVIIPSQSFSTETARKVIADGITKLEANMNEMGAPDCSIERANAVLQNACCLIQGLNYEENIDEFKYKQIVFSCIYAYCKQNRLDNWLELRGIVGRIVESELVLTPYFNDSEYSRVVRESREGIVVEDLPKFLN